MSEAIIMAFSANKGGIGKSFLAVNTGTFLQMEGKKVLFVCLDKQDDLDIYLDPEIQNAYEEGTSPSLSDVINGEADIHDAIYSSYEYQMYEFKKKEDVPTLSRLHYRFNQRHIARRVVKGESFRLSIIPSGGSSVLVAKAYMVNESGNRVFDNLGHMVPDYNRLYEELIEPVINEYDYIIFDCPTEDSNPLVRFAYSMCDYIVLPFHGIDSFRALPAMTETIHEVNTFREQNSMEDVKMLIVNNMKMSVRAADQNWENVLKQDPQYKDLVMKSVIRNSADAENAKGNMMPVPIFSHSDLSDDLFLYVQELRSIVEGV